MKMVSYITIVKYNLKFILCRKTDEKKRKHELTPQFFHSLGTNSQILQFFHPFMRESPCKTICHISDVNIYISRGK